MKITYIYTEVSLTMMHKQETHSTVHKEKHTVKGFSFYSHKVHNLTSVKMDKQITWFDAATQTECFDCPLRIVF